MYLPGTLKGIFRLVISLNRGLLSITYHHNRPQYRNATNGRLAIGEGNYEKIYFWEEKKEFNLLIKRMSGERNYELDG